MPRSNMELVPIDKLRMLRAVWKEHATPDQWECFANGVFDETVFLPRDQGVVRGGFGVGGRGGPSNRGGGGGYARGGSFWGDAVRGHRGNRYTYIRGHGSSWQGRGQYNQ